MTDRPRPSTHLAYRPALDGLRAFAVGSVVLYHVVPGWAPGGWFGVDVFFVLSGFLITSLLLTEARARRRIDLRAFWFARARRLLPALSIVLVVVAVLSLRLLPGSRQASVGWDVLATAAYVQNWHLIVSDSSYFATLALPSPLLHAWSLAIEEQFYLLFPLLMTLLLVRRRVRRGVLVAILGGAALLSAAWMVVLFDPTVDASRVYYGTDTRAFELLVGATAAALLRVSAGVRARVDTWARRLSLPAFAVVLVSFALATRYQDALLSGGLLPLCVVVAVVVLAAASPQPSSLQRLLSAAPLTSIGLISYGLYLWHWPVLVFVHAAALGLSSAGTSLLVVVLSWLAALLSYHLVERPVRRGGLRALIPSRPAVGRWAAVGTALVLVTGTTALARGDEVDRVASGPTRPVTGWTAPVTPVTTAVIGNSIPLSLAVNFPAASLPGLGVRALANVGCDGIDDPKVVDGTVTPPTAACRSWRDAWPADLRREPVDVALVFVTQAALADHRVAGEIVTPTSAGYEAFVRGYLDEQLSLAGPGARHVAVVNLSCHRVATFDKVELVRMNDVGLVRRLNAITAAWARERDVPVLDQFEHLCGRGFRDTVDGVELYEDGFHFSARSAPIFWDWAGPRILTIAAAD